jgi:hypothetical protein
MEGGLYRSPGVDVAHGARSPDADQACQLHARNGNTYETSPLSWLLRYFQRYINCCGSAASIQAWEHDYK